MSNVVEGEIVGESIAPLVVQQPQAIAEPTFFSAMRPADKVAFATEVANALRPILTQKNLVKHLNNRDPDDEYVELEGWQTCAALCNMAAKVEWVRKLADGSGFEARAVVLRTDTGLVIGGGESECARSESKWKNRDDYALKGMAQTRAQSRALRGQLAWILVLAGYKPTPAEEMPGYETSRTPQSVSSSQSKVEATRNHEGSPEPSGTPITIKARADLNALVSGQHLTPSEIQEVVGECLRDGRHHFDQLETLEEARLVYKALLDAKERVTTEIPL